MSVCFPPNAIGKCQVCDHGRAMIDSVFSGNDSVVRIDHNHSNRRPTVAALYRYAVPFLSCCPAMSVYIRGPRVLLCNTKKAMPTPSYDKMDTFHMCIIMHVQCPLLVFFEKRKNGTVGNLAHHR